MKWIALVLASSLTSVSAFELPKASQQCVVGISSDWKSSKVELACYEKRGGNWARVHGPWPGRLGRSGTVWGRGLHPTPTGASMKKEGDGRAPAGIFHIGGAWGYQPAIKRHPKLFYRQITPRDLWVEDSSSPSYNRHLILDHDPSTTWEKQQQMRQGDHAHSLKLFIAHNSPPQVVPGGGSAIFFHIWRGGGTKPTAGCSTLPEANLRTLISWIDPAKQPLYVLLPKAEYEKHRSSWLLP